MGEGIIFDPFAGSGSTLAAAEHIGYKSVGCEIDDEFFKTAQKAIPQLASLYPEQMMLNLQTEKMSSTI